MNNIDQLKKNKSKNYLFIFLQNINFTRGIWMIYLASKGLSLTELGLLETIFHITSFTMEVPTGAIADIYGRRTSRILGRFFSVISVAILLMANSFMWFAFSFVITALSYNMESGAGEALLYDSMKEIGEENGYMSIAGNNEMLFQIANIISFMIGGYIATKSYKIAFGITIVIGMISFLYSFTFVEPNVGHKTGGGVRKFRFWNHVKESCTILKRYKKVGFLILFSELIMSFTTTIFFYLQNYMKGEGYTEAFIGMIYAVSAFGAAMIAPYIHKIEGIMKEHGILLFMPIFIIVCIWGIALSPFHYMFFIPISLAEGFIIVAINVYINKIIPSANRATILSISSMVFSFFMISIFPVVGLLGDEFSLKASFLILALAGSVLVVFNTVIMCKR